MSVQVCAYMSSQLDELFQCEQTSRGHVRVRTPFLYPDGGIVDVFVVERGDTFTITDFGEALGWLRMQTVSGSRSPKQQRLVQDVCLTLGVELFKGQLLIRCNEPERLSDCIVRLGQAVVRVSDLWFTTRTRSIETVSDEVADFLEEKEIPYDRNVKLPGRSGRNWIVDFHTRTEKRSAFVNVLASGSRAAARQVTEHVVAQWHDLSSLLVSTPGLVFVSLFDDTANVWSEQDFKLLDSLSEVCRWSRSDEVERLLKAA